MGLTALAGALWLSGCASVPTSSAVPDLVVPPAWQQAAAAPDAAPSFPPSSPQAAAPTTSVWWRSLGDAGLTAVIEQALAVIAVHDDQRSASREIGNRRDELAQPRRVLEQLAAVVHDKATTVDVLYLDGAPGGFFELHRDDDNTMDLAYFGLLPEAQGRGLGKWFLKQAIDTVWTAGASRLTVNTCTLDHKGALPLYQKLGFHPIGQSETIIHPLTDEDHLRIAKL